VIYVSVDVEADGPAPGLFSMLSVGAVVVEPSLDRAFYAELRPLDGARSNPDALKASGLTREQVAHFVPAAGTMARFDEWVRLVGSRERVLFVSDNAGFDWQLVNYYFHRFVGRNPFGFSPLSLTSLYKGFARDVRANFRPLRRTRHTHNALDDAKGNAEALLALVAQGLRGSGLEVRP
jgi:DNA polymerase III epsilon subunit-like protein